MSVWEDIQELKPIGLERDADDSISQQIIKSWIGGNTDSGSQTNDMEMHESATGATIEAFGLCNCLLEYRFLLLCIWILCLCAVTWAMWPRRYNYSQKYNEEYKKVQ